ncbi:hypothetical protein [Streptomyces sp. SS07]|uniref:hypothetical protein n=1 Tax=Streptomyces sp. SS07 TaxID=2015315 RepID=UPI000B5C2579|nr:hypothetical protein [Streptomyces sp. SS07]
MTAGKGDPVAPPPGPGEYAVRFACKEAVTGWRELGKQAAGNTRKAWEAMRTDPAPSPATTRHHQLKADYAFGVYDRRTLPQWQIEVTGGGRVWYLFDEKNKTCWLKKAEVGHPRETDS